MYFIFMVIQALHHSVRFVFDANNLGMLIIPLTTWLLYKWHEHKTPFYGLIYLKVSFIAYMLL